MTVWLAPGARVNEPPETTLNGAVVEAAPLTVLPDPAGFVTVNERSDDTPMSTVPKSTGPWGEMDKVGGGGGGGALGEHDDLWLHCVPLTRCYGEQ